VKQPFQQSMKDRFPVLVAVTWGAAWLAVTGGSRLGGSDRQTLMHFRGCPGQKAHSDYLVLGAFAMNVFRVARRPTRL
jgi:hypothetical protein